MKQATPRSVVTSAECAAMFGSVANSRIAMTAPRGPSHSRAQQKTSTPSSTPSTTVMNRARYSSRSASLSAYRNR
jgi:hypothetical protein